MLSGELDATQVTLLIHSPSKTFMDPDPVGYRFLVALTLPIDDPYTGPLEIEPAGEHGPDCGRLWPPDAADSTTSETSRHRAPLPGRSRHSGKFSPGNSGSGIRFDKPQSKVEAQSSISNVRRTGWFATMTASGSTADFSVTSRPQVIGS